jgi:hypothetical protein
VEAIPGEGLFVWGVHAYGSEESGLAAADVNAHWRIPLPPPSPRVVMTAVTTRCFMCSHSPAIVAVATLSHPFLASSPLQMRGVWVPTAKWCCAPAEFVTPRT